MKNISNKNKPDKRHIKIDYRDVRSIRAKTDCATIPSAKLTGLTQKQQREYSKAMKLHVHLGLESNNPPSNKMHSG